MLLAVFSLELYPQDRKSGLWDLTTCQEREKTCMKKQFRGKLCDNFLKLRYYAWIKISVTYSHIFMSWSNLVQICVPLMMMTIFSPSYRYMVKHSCLSSHYGLNQRIYMLCLCDVYVHTCISTFHDFVSKSFDAELSS